MQVKARIISTLVALVLGTLFLSATPARAQNITTLFAADELPSNPAGLSCDMTVAETGDIVLRIGGNLYDPLRKQWLLDRERTDRPTLRVSPGRADIMLVSELSAVSLTPDNVLLAVDGTRMGFVSQGDIGLRLDLPNIGLRLAAGPGNQIYLFGGDGANAAQYQTLLDELAETEARLGSQSVEAVRLRGKIGNLPRSYLVYRFSREGGLTLAFEALDTVSDLVVLDDGALFSTGAGIYRYDTTGGVQPVAVFADGAPIDSIAYDAPSDRLFFVRDRDLYALMDGEVRLVAGQAADQIVYRGGRLYLCDSEHRRIGRMDF